jgi:hypothetical protein
VPSTAWLRADYTCRISSLNTGLIRLRNLPFNVDRFLFCILVCSCIRNKSRVCLGQSMAGFSLPFERPLTLLSGFVLGTARPLPQILTSNRTLYCFAGAFHLQRLATGCAKVADIIQQLPRNALEEKARIRIPGAWISAVPHLRDMLGDL